MTDVLVSRLRLVAPSDHAVRARVRIEDALRLADPDDRLLVCRRLDLGPVPIEATARQWAERAVAQVGGLRGRSVHASWPGAADRDAVWFHSAEEARALLLRELAAGRTPSAWFWRLAVRDWGGVPLPVWLPRLLRQAVADPVVLVSVARAVIAVATSGRLAAIVAALAHVVEPPGSLPSAVMTVSGRAGADRVAMLARARRLIARLDPPAIQAITRSLLDPATPEPARIVIARLALIAAEPALATEAAVVTAMAAALILDAEALGRSETPEQTGQPTPHAPVDAEARDAADAAIVGAVRTHAEPTARLPRRHDIAPESSDSPLGRHPAVADEPPLPRVATEEQRSRTAGLFLVIRPLILMGFAEWLGARPDLTDARFPRLLLHAIATRMRAPTDDPVFAAIGLDAADLDAASEGPIARDLTAWRVGLDRWLRRVACVRLVDVATRPGWILNAGEHLRVRYRVDDADVRLRRRALDLDPGWVPWLGWVVHYHYSDQPLV